MTGRLLDAAGITVTAVTVTDLGPGVTATRVDIAVHGGTRQVTTSLADGLALAVITGAPLAVDGPVMDRLAEPVTGPDLLSPFRSRQPEDPEPGPRFDPATWRFPRACADGGLPAPACARSPGPTTPAPSKTGGRSWPRPCPNPPHSPSSARRSSPRTTRTAPSPSAATCAPPASPTAPGWCSASPATGPRHGEPARTGSRQPLRRRHRNRRLDPP